VPDRRRLRSFLSAGRGSRARSRAPGGRNRLCGRPQLRTSAGEGQRPILTAVVHERLTSKDSPTARIVTI